jgi:hypothetical protein
MKTHEPIPLPFTHSGRAGFTPSIQKKALHPLLFPFSSKKLTAKGVKCERERHQQW